MGNELRPDTRIATAILVTYLDLPVAVKAKKHILVFRNPLNREMQHVNPFFHYI
jgi:hypothetical protein